MSIYGNSPINEKGSKATPVGDIRNSKELQSVVKLMKKGPSTAKEILFDHDDNVIGILQRNDTPYFFTKEQQKEFLKIIEG